MWGLGGKFGVGLELFGGRFRDRFGGVVEIGLGAFWNVLVLFRITFGSYYNILVRFRDKFSFTLDISFGSFGDKFWFVLKYVLVRFTDVFIRFRYNFWFFLGLFGDRFRNKFWFSLEICFG